MWMKYLVFLSLFHDFSPQVECAKILGVFHMCGPSHYLAGSSLMRILSENGHDVTIVAAFSEKNPPPNYKQVVLTGQNEKLRAFRPNFFDKTFTTFDRPFDFNKMSISLIEDMFNHTEFRKFMGSNQTFDVVIVEEFQSEAVKYLAHHFKAPLIIYSSMDTNEWTNPYLGNPDSPAYIPNVFHKFSCQMSFFERVHNTFYYVYSNLVRVLINIPMHNRLVQKYFPGAPDIDDIIYNVSLALLNSDVSIHTPVPKVPSMVNIGGFHLKEPKPLPEDLQTILNDTKDGIIYFSLGSTLKSSMMPKEKLELLFRVFSGLKETVLWKYEEDNLTGKPPNVITRKWFPQSDILGL
ncbi:UDP-glucosyltransferase 2-like isoform X2 [Coccinella septempunctata]|uniref:UDP-glucosyltransferase 2-like isoform X2 n=1 Tax=Coccinella septempunctata TaxID=41139 RepID=UPI001D07048A|nr:UDP-glucosyltransferase 2-like isoform X2 [Coccinella septempunctata]